MSARPHKVKDHCCMSKHVSNDVMLVYSLCTYLPSLDFFGDLKDLLPASFSRVFKPAVVVLLIGSRSESATSFRKQIYPSKLVVPPTKTIVFFRKNANFGGECWLSLVVE